jgi:hypothetical protein
MDEKTISSVAAILLAWNPLGSDAENTASLDDYRPEAIDIIFHLGELRVLNEKQVTKVVKNILSEAFLLALTHDECVQPARDILRIVSTKQ